MPWQGKQAQAIFLSKKRELGEEGARKFMREHGNKSEKRGKRKKRNRKRDEMIAKFQKEHGGGRGR
jgi:hypothetical protein